MRGNLESGGIGLLCVAMGVSAGWAQTLEVGFPRASWAGIGAPVVGPDPEAITVDPATGNLVMTNGEDTNDADGDAILAFSAGAPGGFVKAYASGDDLEARIAAFTGLPTSNFTNVAYTGIGANAGGDVIVPLDKNAGAGSPAWLLRVNASSNTAGVVSVDVLSGSNTGGGPIDGTVHMTMDGNTVYLLQRASAGSPETRIVTFNSTAAAQGAPGSPVNPTIFLSEAELIGAIDSVVNDLGLTTSIINGLNSIAVSPAVAGRPRSLVVVAGDPNLLGLLPASRNIFYIPLDKSQPLSLLKSGLAMSLDFGLYLNFYGIADGGIAIDPIKGDIYLANYDTNGLLLNNQYDIYRLDGTTLTAQVFRTEASIEADPVYTGQGSPGDVKSQSFGFAVSGRQLYTTLETTTAGTGLFARLSLPTTPGDMNNDGYCTADDVTALGNAVSGIAPFTPGVSGDVNGDLVTNMADVTALAVKIVNQ